MTEDQLNQFQHFLMREEAKDVDFLARRMAKAIVADLRYAYLETCTELKQILTVCSPALKEPFARHLKEECAGTTFDVTKLLPEELHV